MRRHVMTYNGNALMTHIRFSRLLNQHNELRNPEMTLVTFKVMKMASLTRVRFGYFPTKYVHVLSKQSNIFRHRQKVLFHISSWLNVKGQEIKMPSLSPTMTEGKIVKWLKKEGDSVSPGDVLCDIETDKAVVSMETEEEGILAKIVIPENTSEIKVGSLIAMMVGEGEDWKSVELPSGSGSSSEASSGDSSKSQPEEIPKTTGPPTIQIKMPSLSPTMTSGTIVKWLKKEGDPIAPGDVLCDIQTDKAVMSMETEEEGILAKILAPDDSKDVNVGTLIALIVAEGEDWKSVVVPSVKSSEPAKEPAAVTQPATPGKSVATKSYGPAVRSLLEMYQLEPGTIKATGRNNKLLKEDVLRYIAENKLQKKPPKSVAPPSTSKSAPGPAPSKPSKKPTVSSRRGPKYVDIELTNIRKVIAKRLTQSKQEIPHSYGNITCNVDKLLELRRQFLDDGGKASVNDFIIKAVAFALQECPKINANYVNNDVKLLNNIDISVAVATDNGLITPIIKSANTKDIGGISQEVKELAGRARKGSLKPEEFQGGTFTISNLGMFGVAHFSAIINPPQCAILAVGGSTERLGSDFRTYNDVRLTLSYDRRAIQEDEAAEFLEALRNVIENPKRLLSDNKVKSAVRL